MLFRCVQQRASERKPISAELPDFPRELDYSGSLASSEFAASGLFPAS